jgi:hypothetical protein
VYPDPRWTCSLYPQPLARNSVQLSPHIHCLWQQICKSLQVTPQRGWIVSSPDTTTIKARPALASEARPAF